MDWYSCWLSPWRNSTIVTILLIIMGGSGYMFNLTVTRATYLF